VIIEFTPFLATKKVRLAGWSEEPNMQLGDVGWFFEDAKKKGLGKALGEGSYHYFLGGFSPSRFKEWSAGKLYGDFAPCGTTRVTGGAATQAATDALCRDLLQHFNGRLPAWIDDARGFRKLAYPDTAESYRAMALSMQDPELLRRDFQWRNEAEDLVNLDFDPELVAEFIAVVKEAKALAPRVFVFTAPVNPDWARPTPLGRERFEKTKATIAQETGIPVVDWSEDPAFVGADFIDSTHLNQVTGVQKFSPRIAARLREIL